MAGSEENFAKLMTDRARELGFPRSVYKNSTGLPAEGQVVTVRELALLGLHIWKEYPDFYKLYAQPDFTWNKIFQKNRNPLLAMDIGADGMKTGFTEESGYAIVGSASRGDRRVFAALSGLTSERERAEEARKLIDWGMKAFERKQLFGEYHGAYKSLGLAIAETPLHSDGNKAVIASAQAAIKSTKSAHAVADKDNRVASKAADKAQAAVKKAEDDLQSILDAKTTAQAAAKGA